MSHTCKKCNKIEPEVKFYIVKATGKLRTKCTNCMNAEQRGRRLKNLDSYQQKEQKYREKNRGKIRSQYASKEYKAKYYQDNKEDILEKHKEYNDKNAEKIKQQKRQYYLDNKERILKRTSEYYKLNRDAAYARHGKRRALLQNAVPGWLSKTELTKIDLLYKIARKVQDVTGVAMHVDHIYPLGGKTVCGLHCLANLQILTARENLEKGNSFPDEKYLKE